MYTRFKENEGPFDPVEFGFEFSFEEIEERVGLFEGRAIGCRYSEDEPTVLSAAKAQKEFAGIHAAELRRERLAA